jgi:hypothetical protein
MATKLFLRATSLHRHGTAGRFDLLPTAGSSLTTAVVNNAASGTEIQWTKLAAGQVLEWISPPLAADFLLATTDTMTFNLWAKESKIAANCGVRVRVIRYSAGDGSVGFTPGGPYNKGTELTTSIVAQNFTGVVTSNQQFYTNDRIAIRVYITNVGTMGSGQTCTMDYDAATGGADGDSWFQLNNTVTFKTENEQSCMQRLPIPPTSGWGAVPGHPLAPRHAWFFGEQGSPNSTDSTVRDRVGNRHGKFKPVTVIPTPFFRMSQGVRFRTQSDLVNFGPETLICPTDGKVTIVAALRYHGDDRGTAPMFFCASETTTDAERIEFGPNSDTALILRYGGISEGTNQLTVTGLTLLGKDLVVAATTGPRGMEIWQDGRKLGSNAGTPTRTGNAAKNFNAGATTEARGALMTLGYLAVYRRQLTPAELVQVTRAPF